MSSSDKFLQDNFKYFQQPQHWHDKAVSLRRSARAIYKQIFPALRRYDNASRKAMEKLKRRLGVKQTSRFAGIRFCSRNWE